MEQADNTCCPPPQNTPLLPESQEASDELLAQMAKALGHPARIAILRILTRRTECVCGEIVEELPLAQSTVSQHLKILKKAGFIRGEVDGPRVCYCIEPAYMELFKSLVSQL